MCCCTGRGDDDAQMGCYGQLVALGRGRMPKDPPRRLSRSAMGGMPWMNQSNGRRVISRAGGKRGFLHARSKQFPARPGRGL